MHAIESSNVVLEQKWARLTEVWGTIGIKTEPKGTLIMHQFLGEISIYFLPFQVDCLDYSR